MKKKKNVIIIMFFIFLITIITLFTTGVIKFGNLNKNSGIISHDDENDSQDKEIGVIGRKTDGDTIKFYTRIDGIMLDDYEEIMPLSQYNCTSSNCDVCNSYNVCSGIQLNFKDKNLIALVDYNENLENNNEHYENDLGNIILWDAVKGKEVNRFDNIIETYSLLDNDNKIEYMILKYNNKNVYLYDYRGNYLRNITNNKIVTTCYEGCYTEKSSYLLDNDMIVLIKDNKYGIEKITKAEIIVDYKYDNIILYDDFVVTSEGNSIPELYA